MATPPLVSVCMTTYNHEAYLAQAIESVLAQKTSFGVAGVKRKKVASLADFGQIAARNDRCAVVHNADHTVDTIAHLVNDPLKKPV